MIIVINVLFICLLSLSYTLSNFFFPSLMKRITLKCAKIVKVENGKMAKEGIDDLVDLNIFTPTTLL